MLLEVEPEENPLEVDRPVELKDPDIDPPSTLLREGTV